MYLTMDLANIKWNTNTYKNFINYLKSFQDVKYQKFHSGLVPNCSPDKIIGIRTPVLRKIGKEISKGNYEDFLKIAKSDFYEEIIIKAVVIGLIKVKDFEELADWLDFYAPLVNNWATCDIFCSSFKEAKKYRAKLLKRIKEYIKSPNPWYVRLALVLLLTYYLDEEYIETSLKLAETVQSDFYYVSMAQAWLVATAFAKNETFTMEFFKKCKLNDVTFNKAIQKARESYRVSKETKSQLNEMKRTLDKQN